MAGEDFSTLIPTFIWPRSITQDVTLQLYALFQCYTMLGHQMQPETRAVILSVALFTP